MPEAGLEADAELEKARCDRSAQVWVLLPTAFPQDSEELVLQSTSSRHAAELV